MNTTPVIVTAPKPALPVPTGKAESPGLQALRLALAVSKRIGHTPCIAHAVGVYPA